MSDCRGGRKQYLRFGNAYDTRKPALSYLQALRRTPQCPARSPCRLPVLHLAGYSIQAIRIGSTMSSIPLSRTSVPTFLTH